MLGDLASAFGWVRGGVIVDLAIEFSKIWQLVFQIFRQLSFHIFEIECSEIWLLRLHNLEID